jgi:hypothetical protein
VSRYLDSWEARAALALTLLAVAGFWLNGFFQRRAAARESLPPALEADSLARLMLERDFFLRTGPVAINSATEKDLLRLDGIGPELAARIMRERTRGGPFRGGADLAARVRGIGPAAVDRLSSRLVFTGAPGMDEH